MEGWKRRLVDGSELVALLGLVFVIVGVTLWYLEPAPAAESFHQALISLVTYVLFGGVVLVLGIHIERSELLPEERLAVIIWCYGGFTLMFASSVWGHLGAILDGRLTTAFASDFLVFTSLGGAFGVIAGINWGTPRRTNAWLQKSGRNERRSPCSPDS